MENRKIRVSVQLEIELTGQEERRALPTPPSGYSRDLRDVIQAALQEGRYTLVGESTIYAPAVKKFNQIYGTTYPEHPITTRALSAKPANKTTKKTSRGKGMHKGNPDRYLLPEEALLNDILDTFDL